MSRSTTASRIRRAATLAGAVAALAVVAPTAAHAAPIGWGGTLLPGQTQCISRYANSSVYQVRVEGDATRKGVRFRFKKDGAVLDATWTDTVTRYAAERRTSSYNYPGPGVYEICAANHQTTNTLVNIRVLFNSEFL